MMYGLRHRVVLVSALRGVPVALSLLDTVGELGGLGLVAHVLHPDGSDVLRVMLTEGGRVAARREWQAVQWMLWRRLYEARRARAVELYGLGDVEASRRLHARARRALDRARVAFSAAYEVAA